MIAPTLIQYHSEQSDEYTRGQNITDPLFTVDTANRHAYVTSCLIQYHGASNEQGLSEPLSTTLSKNHDALVVPYISKFYSGGYTGKGVNITEPVSTVTTVDHNALAAAHVIKMKGDNLGQDIQEPMQTITASGLHFGAVTTTIVQAHPEMNLYNWSKIRELLNKYCGYTLKDDEILLIAIKGEWYIIADIGLRMLLPRELFAANGFPSDYIIDRDYLGNEYSKTKQVARCGNAVPPPFATAIVQSNAPEYCGQKISTMRELNEIIAV
jgi:DNA (cytosine-5)-methyltransferase 1